MLSIVPYLLLGCMAGFLSGLFGIGGGAIIVPILLLLFTARDLPEPIMMQLAVGTSLAVITITALSSIRAHMRYGNVQWFLVRKLVPGIGIGALSGSIIAAQLSFEALRTIFAVFLLLLALQMLVRVKPGSTPETPSWGLSLPVGTGIGLVSALVGIAGGAMTTPILSRWGHPMKKAVATSITCGFPLAVVGTGGYLMMGWSNPLLPSGSTGYIYWPAMFWIALASIFIAPLGARVAQNLPDRLLRIIFMLFLLSVSLSMFLN